jgi:outer membrane protein OmpA-like peptidoglycan-associated protein
VIYKRTINGDVNDTEGKFKTSIHVPAGVGFEAFISNDVSIAADIGYRITDDYTDGLKAGSIDVYAIAKVGVNFYFGTSASEKSGLTRSKTRQTKEATEAELRRVKELTDAEALRTKALADAEARRAKDSTEAEVRRLVELNAHRPAVDTVIVLFRGQTVILKGIYFESGKAAVTVGSESTLRSAFNALLASPDVKVLIVGHTDKTGSRTYNKKLSLRRAQTVRSWLVREGISVKRLTVAGKGFDEPIDDNSTPEGQANNRRIEFRVLK